MTKASKKRVIIIGAGFGGLATANLLAKEGYEVHVYEQRDQAGGRAGTYEAEGFRFDTGPSWYLMPEVFEHYFSLLDERIEDHIHLTRLDPAYQIYYGDKSSVKITGDLTIDSETVERLEPGAGKQLRTYIDDAARIYNLATAHFLYNNFTSLRSFLFPQLLLNTPRLFAGLLLSLHHRVARQFKNLHVQQLLEYPMVFLGTSPFSAPSMYRLMSHMDFKQGVFYPEGGIYSLVTALMNIGQQLGVVYHFNQEVEHITVSKQCVSGIRLRGGVTKKAEIVISNADLHFTETTLLPVSARSYSPAYWRMRQAGPSALLMYLGIRGSLPELSHHSLLFIDAWQKNFHEIYKQKQWPDEASLYICKPSATDQAVAPKGYENLFVLVPGPSDDGTTTKRELHDLADRYLDQIAKTCGIPDLKERIVYQRVYGPADFKADFHAWQGGALGLSHTLRQSAFFRPRNESKKVKGLYYVGAGTVPGIGLPMCLISAELILKRLRHDGTGRPIPLAKRPQQEASNG